MSGKNNGSNVLELRSSSEESLASSLRSAAPVVDNTKRSVEPGIADGGQDLLLNELKTFAGKHKEWRDFERVELVFLVLAVGSILVTAGLTIDHIASSYRNKGDEAEFTFAVLLLVNATFTLFYVVHGVLYESLEEVIVFAAGCCIVTLYVIMDYAINVKHRSSLKLGRLVLVCVASPVLVPLAIYVGKNFRWLEFRVVGALENMQAMYKTYARFCSLLKFDLQLACSLVILILRKGGDAGPLEITILSIGVVYCFAWAILGFVAARKESPRLVIVFYVLALPELGYIIYKCVAITQNWDVYVRDHIQKLAYTLYAVAALAIITRGLLLYVMEKVRANFDRGLKELLG